MKVTIDSNELYNLIKKAIKEVLDEEALIFFLKSVPLISHEEMEDIIKLYGKPSKEKEVAYSETIDIWHGQ